MRQARLLALLTVAVAAAVAVTMGACARPPETVTWQGRVFHEVRSVAQLPAAIQTSLGADRPGTDGIADRGRPFNVTDVTDSRLPMRRFLTAGHEGDTWIVALERGGRSHGVDVYMYAATGPVLQQHWGLRDRPNSLTDVVQSMSGKRRKGP